MSYDVKDSRSYEKELTVVRTAALGAIAGLEGSVLSQSDDRIEAKFNKTILGKVLGDRSQIEIDLKANGGGTQVYILLYPLDPVGRKLMFGARKGVTKTVQTWFWAHLEHRLG